MRLLFVSALCLLAAPAAFADLQDEVRCSEIGFSRSVENGDPGAFAALIDGDARFVGDSITRGPEAIMAAWQVFFSDEGPRIKWRPRIVEVLGDGTLALTRGPYRMTVRDDDGNVSEHWGTFNSIWRRQPDGQWKVVFDAGSASDEPPAADVRALLDQDDDCSGK
jgi:ketosteroid isomerase-like protein